MDEYLEKSDFANLPELERIKALDDHAQKKIPGFSYSKHLTQFDIDTKNVELNQALQEIERLKNERKKFSQLIASQWQIVQNNSKEVVQKFTNVTETAWEINNFDTGYMELINTDGLVIQKTRLKGGIQMNIFNSQKEAM